MKGIIFSALLTLPLSSFAFSDITIRDSVYDSTTYLESVGVFSGYEDGTFGRDKTINRAEAMKTIYEAVNTTRAAEKKLKIPSPTTQQFNDVPIQIWFAPYVNYAADNDVVKGDDASGLFAPARNVNKAEFLKMMMLAFEVNPADYPVITDVALNDVPAGVWFEPFFKFAVKFNIITPDADNNVLPSQELSRGQASEILFSMIRQGKGLQPQNLLNLSERHLLKSIEFMDQGAAQSAAVLANVSKLFANYALEQLPENNVVQSVPLVVEALTMLTTTYTLGSEGKLEAVIGTAKAAWAKADESFKLNPQNKALTDKIKDIAAAIADKAREQQADSGS